MRWIALRGSRPSGGLDPPMPAKSAQPDRHDDADEAVERLEHARAHLVLQFKENLILREGAQRIHHEDRVEGDLQVRAAVTDGHRLVRLAEIGTLRRDLEQVAAEL